MPGSDSAARILRRRLEPVIGILFAANPGRSAVGLAVLLGVLAIAWGVVLLGAGLAVRRDARQLTA